MYSAEIERLLKSKNAETRRIGILAGRYLSSQPNDGRGRPLPLIIADIRALLPHVATCDEADAQSVTANLKRIANLKELYTQGYTAIEARAIVEGGAR